MPDAGHQGAARHRGRHADLRAHSGRFPNSATIEVDILSRLNDKGPPDARAFIGISYRITDPEAHFEAICVPPP